MTYAFSQYGIDWDVQSALGDNDRASYTMKVYSDQGYGNIYNFTYYANSKTLFLGKTPIEWATGREVGDLALKYITAETEDDIYIDFLEFSQIMANIGFEKPSGTFYSSSSNLTNEEMNVNATIIYNLLIDKGWSNNAIYAVLGNMQAESGINPGKSESEGSGYGLVQWTYKKQEFFNWQDKNGYARDDLYGQIDYLLYQLSLGSAWWNKDNSHPDYYMPLNDFITSNKSVEYLTQVFLWSYERPSIPHTQTRIDNANYWGEYFSNRR